MRPESSQYYDVFLSHRSDDKAAVEHIAARLEDEGKLRPFLDKWHLVPGTPLQEELEGALQNSASCAVFIGPSGLSPWENEEARVVLESRIRNGKLRVIPVLLPGAKEETICTLPPLLRRFLWVDFRSGLDELDPFERLVAGVKGKPPGRKSSGTLSKDSIFVKKSTSDLLKSFSKLGLTGLQLDTNIPLDTFAKIIRIHNPNLQLGEIKSDLSQARSKIYDEKYSERLSNDDERYIDFNGWQTQLRKLLYEIGFRDFTKLDVVNVGIGNGNECPDFYREFRSFTGVDVSEKSLEKAWRVMPFMKPVQGEAECLDKIPTASQDLYISLRTYQSSFFNIEDSVIEASRVMRRRGTAIISIPHIYVENGKVARGLQKSGSHSLDPHLPWELADRVRRALYQADFDCSIYTGNFELYIIGQK